MITPTAVKYDITTTGPVNLKPTRLNSVATCSDRGVLAGKGSPGTGSMRIERPLVKDQVNCSRVRPSWCHWLKIWALLIVARTFNWLRISAGSAKSLATFFAKLCNLGRIKALVGF